MDPRSFDILVQLLEPHLQCNEEMKLRAMKESRSGPITVTSRVGAGLIMLAGGRFMESLGR